ncbi:MAG: hypothetical protein WD751_10880 [Anaerolineales bacterium]
MSDLYEQVQNDQDIFRKIAGKIPGFSGYVARENRRAADKLLRESIADKYELIWKRVGNLQKELADAQELEYLDNLEGAATKLRTFIDKVRTASYGNAGFFDAKKIKSPELKRLYEFDLALVERADSISAGVDAVQAAVGTEDMAAPVTNLVNLTRDLVSTFDQRSEVITAEP